MMRYIICKEYMPDREFHTESHYSCCWLNHPMAKDVAEGRGIMVEP